MSDKIEIRGPDSELVGIETHMSPRKPTKRSSSTATTSNEACRLSVRCRRRRLLGVYGAEPETLLGSFAGDALMLAGTKVVAPRPDLILMGLDPAQRPVVADAGTPLQVWCPNHKDGHEVDPALLRAEVSKADKARTNDPWCPVGRVEA